jgi:hypothetical protein
LTTAPPVWATASDSESARTTPMELAALGEHRQQCSRASGRLVAVQCGVARLLGFVDARRVTTVAALATGAAALLMWW